MKCIGFDATEDHRTYATGGNIRICPDPDLPAYPDRYVMRYPLREWGLDRATCGKIIVDAGLPLPPKSACFFCPAMKPAEIEVLRQTDPVQFALAMAMEDRYRKGKHFRGDNLFTVKAKRKDTGETVEAKFTAATIADARQQFRAAFDDTARPYKYAVSVSSAVVGLGRDFAWSKRFALPMAPETEYGQAA